MDMDTAADERARWLEIGSIAFCVLALTLFFFSITLDPTRSRFTILVFALALSIVGVVAFHLFYWRDVRKHRIQVDAQNYEREREFASVFDHALDGILILDDRSVCKTANPAACRILGLDGTELTGRCFGDFHPDRDEFAQTWKEFLALGYLRGQMCLVVRDKTSVFIEYTAAANYVPGQHILILCDATRRKHAETSLQNVEERFRQMDVTTRKHAETQIAAHLAAAEAARSEAGALRKATLALTQNLAMDSILDTLLACLADVVPYDSAAVLFSETDFQLLVAREAPRRARGVIVLDPAQHPFLNKVLIERHSVLLSDTTEHSSWTKPRILSDARCWMGVPLLAADELLGMLSLVAGSPNAFTPEHLRLAKSLAIAAAVGIQNARARERAAIYASELEVQLKNLQQMRKALQGTRGASPHN